MRRFIALAASAAAVAGTFAMTVPAKAAPAECGAKGTLAAAALGIRPIDAGPAGKYYVDDRGFVGGNGTWIYKETNGMANLQRGGNADNGFPKPVGPTLSDNGSSEICTDLQGATKPDTLYV